MVMVRRWIRKRKRWGGGGGVRRERENLLEKSNMHLAADDVWEGDPSNNPSQIKK